MLIQLGTFMRMLGMPNAAEPWSLTSLCEKLIEIGAKIVNHLNSVLLCKFRLRLGGG
jgi:hypothetical protein